MKTRALSVAAAAGEGGLATKAGDGKKVYVPVIRTDHASRLEAFRLTELLIKTIERDTPHKVVGSRDEADLVLEAVLKPTAAPAR